MRKRILNYVGFMIILSMVLTFVSASVIMYVKTNEWMEQDVRNEAQYVRLLLEQTTDSGWEEQAGTFTTSRITILNEDGTVQYDSEEDSATMGNHKDRPEVKQAMEEGEGETVRFSETLSKKTFYYALRLDDGRLVRVAKTTDSVFQTMFSGLFLMGILLIVILAFAFLLVEKQTSKLIKPINHLDLEEPLSSVAYEELRPLLVRIDDQNHQLKQQLEELKKAEEVPENFHARYNCKGKKYRYIINNSYQGTAIYRDLECHIPQKLDIEKMQEGIKFFEGKHDFKGFKASGTSGKSTVREIYKAEVKQDGERIIIELTGNGFMYNMVRIISGTIVDVGLGKITPNQIPDIINAKDRTKAGKTLPASGLYLVEVYY